jgi:hypothetical protein
MRTPDGAKPEVITAKWKTALDSKEEHFGTITLDDEFQLTFPILHSFADIPSETTVLWGVTDKLKRCTALTLPFGPHGTVSRLIESNQSERLFNASRAIRHLLIGQKHLNDPTGDFVSQIAFTPKPNEDLRKLSFDSAPTELFETVLSPGLTVSASVAGDLLGLCLRFKSARTLNDALEEANVLCVFLSFVGHQYVYPGDFHVWAVGEDEAYQVHCRAFSSSRKREETWVGYTLLLPDEQPAFSDALGKWYSTNGEYLRSRFLYRYSLEEPNTFSPARFLAVFQAVEGIVNKSGYQLLTNDQLAMAKTILRQSLASVPKLNAFINKLNNSESPTYILKQELPRILATANIVPVFDVVEFVDRIYRRRNMASHGGRHLDYLTFDDSLMPDTLLLTAIYLIAESCQLGLDAPIALKKFRGSFFNVELPLTMPV